MRHPRRSVVRGARLLHMRSSDSTSSYRSNLPRRSTLRTRHTQLCRRTRHGRRPTTNSRLFPIRPVRRKEYGSQQGCPQHPCQITILQCQTGTQEGYQPASQYAHAPFSGAPHHTCLGKRLATTRLATIQHHNATNPSTTTTTMGQTL